MQISSTDKDGFRELVGAELSEAEEGRAVVGLRAGRRHPNPSGTVHGEVISTLVDVAMAEAINTTVAVVMEIVEAEVLQEEDGEVAALATGTCTILVRGRVRLPRPVLAGERRPAAS